MNIKTIYMNEEIRIWSINMATLFISLQNIDDILRLLLLLVSVIYTAAKAYKLMKNDKTNEDN